MFNYYIEYKLNQNESEYCHMKFSYIPATGDFIFGLFSTYQDWKIIKISGCENEEGIITPTLVVRPVTY